MKDLKLDFTNKKLINELIDKKDRVLQQIRLAIHVWTGDWMLDETFGVDYDNSWGNMDLMGLYIKDQIKQVSGVQSVTSFSIESISTSTEVYFKVEASIKFNGEVLEISEYIGI